jgi:hypothetical protein
LATNDALNDALIMKELDAATRAQP